MNVRRLVVALNVAGAVALAMPEAAEAQTQCCLSDFFAGFHSCFYKAPPAYAVAPVMAPVAAPVPAPPPPVMVPVQQVSYVPETTYRTEYRSVPVTSYKPSCEIDPCTGCPRECMEQVTNYVQQPVNVPVTQYRAVYSTKYVQMQPQQGYVQPAYGQAAVAPAGMVPTTPVVPSAPAAGSGWVPGTTVAPGPSAGVASPFAAPAPATSAQAWGAAGSDIQQQVLPGQTSISAPALPQGTAVPSTPQIVPQGGTFAAPVPQTPSLRPSAPPSLVPAPSLRPVTEAPTAAAGASGNPASVPAASGPATGDVPSTTGPAAAAPASEPAKSDPQKGAVQPQPSAGAGTSAASTTPRLVPIPVLPASPTGPAPRGPAGGIPTVPGPGPGATTGAFPRLLAPTAHTTSWSGRTPSAPTAALPRPAQQ